MDKILLQKILNHIGLVELSLKVELDLTLEEDTIVPASFINKDYSEEEIDYITKVYKLDYKSL